MKLRTAILCAISLAFFSQNSFAATEFDADSIVNAMKRVAKYRMTYADIRNLFNHTSANKGDKPNQWAGTNSGCDWDVGSFMTGLMALYYTSKDTSYLNFAKRWATAFNWQPCNNNPNATVADNWCACQTYCEIYQLDPSAANANMISGTRQVINNYFNNVKPNPPYVNPNGWWWCDALYMAPPAIARYCKVGNDNKYLDSLNRYWWSVSGHLYNSTQHFYYRDNGTIGSNTFWSGGNAWVIGGLTRVLDYMPKTYANRAKWETQYKDMCLAIKAQQGFTTPYDGMWTTSMLDHNGFPGPESIGTAFFCYAFAWGVRSGLLDSATYTPSINKAWRDLIKNIGSDGRLLKCQHVDWGPTNMLTNGDANNSAPEGEGAFLLAGAEMYLRAKKPTAVTPLTAGFPTGRTGLRVKGSTIIFTIASSEKAMLKVFASSGKLVADLSPALGRMRAGPATVSLQSLRLTPGVYSVVLSEGGKQVSGVVAVVR
jgi:unsaturated rhamnogalacturonyl hydrolase